MIEMFAAVRCPGARTDEPRSKIRHVNVATMSHVASVLTPQIRFRLHIILPSMLAVSLLILKKMRRVRDDDGVVLLLFMPV